MKIAILGAGISGLTVGRKLYDDGYDVKLFEKLSNPGGLATTRMTDGYVFDIYGGHVFNSRHKEIIDWIFELLPKEKWNFLVRNAKILFKGGLVSYPFELSLCELPPDDAVNAAYDFILSQNGEEPVNFRDWLVWNFGRSIADFYMLPYNSKIWNYPLEEMGTTWMRGKMPLPEKKEILMSFLMKDPSERKMPHSTFYYPFKGGIQTMVNAIAENLNIVCNFEINKIIKENNLWFINDEGPFDYIISTIPLPVLNRVLGDLLPTNIKNAISDLKYNGLNTFLCKMPPTDISWMYLPESKYRMHRMGCQGALSPYATPDEDSSGVVEIIGDRLILDDNFIFDEKYVPKDLKLEKVIDREYTEFAYVIHDKNHTKNTTLIKEYFNEISNFELLGRFATWNYNNMDLCMRDAFILYDKIVKNSK